MRRAAPSAALLVLLTVTACTQGAPAPADPAACAGRISAATLDTHFPGGTTADGSFGASQGSTGACTVREDGRRLALLTVDDEPSAAERDQDLELSTDTVDPPPQPTDLGPYVRLSTAEQEPSAGLLMFIGRYKVGVLVEDAENAEAAAQAAVAIARDVTAYYDADPPPAG